jgi:acetylornithine deacetylase
MKSGLAAMTCAVEALRDLRITLKGDVFLEYTVDEEATGNGTLACVQRGYRADAGICCETSSLHVQPACIGRMWFEILVRGKAAGIQRRREGVNAIAKGYAVAEAVAALERRRIDSVRHPLYPDTEGSIPCMVSVFQAGSFPSAFPDTCLLRGSIATVPGEDNRQVQAAFVEHLRAFAGTDAWLKDHQPEVRFIGYSGDPAEIPPDHPIVRTVGEGFRRVTGRDPEITGRQGAADTRYLIRYGHTPTVIFGPGMTEQMHAADEWVETEDVITATKVLALAMLEWCGVEGDASPASEPHR